MRPRRASDIAADGPSASGNVQILVDDPDAPEALWAKPLGGSLYSVRSIPAFAGLASGLHYLDEVECTPKPGGLPQLKRLVKTSGHETLEVVFKKDCPEEMKAAVVRQIRDAGIEKIEKVTFRRWMFSIPPDRDGTKIDALLEAHETAGAVEDFGVVDS